MVNRSVQSSPLFQIRTATLGDLGSLSNLLTTGFYRKDGWTKWLYPLIRLGIHEDLKARLSSRNDRYACLMAVYSASSPVTQASATQASATQASVTQTSVTQAPVTGTLHQKNVRNSGRTDANHIVGTVEISCRPNSLWLLNQPRYLYLSNLTVDTQFRRQGAAQQLLNACEALAMEWGFYELYLHVMEDNHGARRLYQKSGYRLQSVEWSLPSNLLGHSRRLLMRKPLLTSQEAIRGRYTASL